MKLKPNKVFVSAYQASKSLEVNHANHEKAKELLNKEKVQFQVVNGFYKGQRELAFVLISDNQADHVDNLTIAFNLGGLFNQESMLVVHNDDSAELHYFYNGISEKLGTFTEVPESEALTYDSYTYEPYEARYFVVK